MPTLIVDRELEHKLQAERKSSGADRFDEVWNGVYVMNPMPNDQHQQLVNRFSAIFQDAIDWPGIGDVRPGVNVSNSLENWRQNYRVPDVAVFLKEGAAQNHDEFWFGGPDFAVEIVSTDDRTREKIPFYAEVGVRELLIVDRDPWRAEFLRLDVNHLRQVALSTPDNGVVLVSEVLPFTFQMQPAAPRPRIAVNHVGPGRTWLV